MKEIAKHKNLVGTVTFSLLLGVVRVSFPERSMDYVGPRAFLDMFFSVGILGLVVLLSLGTGLKILRWMHISELSGIELLAIGWTLGAGAIAYGLFALGLVGQLNSGSIIFYLLFVFIVAWRECVEFVRLLGQSLNQLRKVFEKTSTVQKLLWTLVVFFLLLSGIQALAPPWDYDGLMYHLPGPQFFLEQERISILPEVFHANSPFTIEMLFTLGLAFGSDVFARLINLIYFGIFLLSTYAFGKRFFSTKLGLSAVFILLGIPILPLLSNLAYVDFGQALYEFLGLFALFAWMRTERNTWLYLSGLLTGFAVGSKYTALMGVFVIGLWLLWYTLSNRDRVAWRHIFVFTGLVVLVSAPWYVKNWVYSGNPVYPLYFGGVGWGQERVGFLTNYLKSFGMGFEIVDFVLLPWNLYAHNDKFATVWGYLDYPSFLFPVLIFFPLISKPRIMAHIAGIAAMRFILWSIGSQQTRFLLPIYPILALMTAFVLMQIAKSSRLIFRWLTILILGLPVLISLLFNLVWFQKVQPIYVVIGLESKNSFLQRTVVNHSAIQFIKRELDMNDRVLFMWDGAGYYCDQRCFPSADQSRWSSLVFLNSDPHSLARELRNMGINHLLLNSPDVEFFLDSHDIDGRHRYAYDFFLNEFQPLCAKEIYSDPWVAIYELIC